MNRELHPLVRSLIEERHSQGMSQVEFAAAIGVGAAMLGNWERGFTQPSLDSLDKIAEALDCEVRFVPKNSINRSRKNNRILN